MAYVAVGYWRITYQKKISVVFVTGKSRCSPLKPLSIGMQAAVLGTRLKEVIIISHNADSKTVINWINTDCRQYKQFVAHRLSEILTYSNAHEWRWVPGSLNPADAATRLKTKTYTSLWLQGPEFLKDSEEKWPKMPQDLQSNEQQQERRAAYIFSTTKCDQIIDWERFSNYYRLTRVMAWVLRAALCLKNVDKEMYESQIPPLTAEEVNIAEMRIAKQVQMEVFSAEISTLKKGKQLPKSSPIFELTPVLDEFGLLRLSGRIDGAECIELGVRRPIIMPKHHVVTTLIIKNYHEKYKHQNQQAICLAIRQKFWVPCLRQQVRSFSSKCQLCKLISAKPKPPLMGQLPPDRLEPYHRPFTYTGLDYFGPLMITVGRHHEKRWVALFTCLTIRAIHLEVAKDLSADSAILCLRNFINRRGVPTRIRCDRGTNFIGVSRDEQANISEYMVDECTMRNIQWTFNAPGNPSAGGAWERMVRSVKRVLTFTLKEKAPRLETLISLLIEAENLINSRPLTQIAVESDSVEPLTPNHFLIGSPNFVKYATVPDRICPKKQWRVLQQMKQTFWKRWVLEYLPELTRRTKWHQHIKPIQVGDLVLVCDENEIRGVWKRGRVVEVSTAQDGQVRSAVVKTTTGLIRRPATKLAVLDVSGESDRVSVHEGEDVKN